jgi:HSP20 family molecular chaperone IbpA
LIIKGRKEKSEGNEKEEAKEIYNSISQKNFEISFKVNDKFDTDKAINILSAAGIKSSMG